jgi:3',5'-cyclic AMP phosphodiesterase CpdA
MPELGRDENVRARILQISDLHYCRKTSIELIGQLTLIAKQEKPDIIVVTGDLTEHPFRSQMKKARAFIEHLQQECGGCRVIVIPGNHDYKYKGLFGFGRLTRIPFHLSFRQRADGQPHRFWQLFRDALTPKGKLMRDPIEFRYLPEFGVCIFSFNSNPLGNMLAGGEVATSDLQDLRARLKDLRTNGELKGLVAPYTIALVHHHPIPTAYWPGTFLDRLFDSGMVFYNAGQFLQDLAEHSFYLVLHGHRHYAAFSRVAFADTLDKSIVVAAAGTCAAPQSDDPERYHLNIIDLNNDGTATMRSHFFNANVYEKETRHYVLHGLHEVKSRRASELQDFWNFRTKKLSKRAIVTEHGHTRTTITYQGCEAVTAAGVKSVPVILDVNRPNYVRDLKLVKLPDTPPSRLVLRNDSTRTKVRANVAFQHSEESFSCAFEFRLLDAHALYEEELKRRDGGTAEAVEFITLDVDVDCDELELEVEFPKGYKPAGDATVEVRCKRLPRTPEFEQIDNLSCRHDSEYRRVAAGLAASSTGWKFHCREPIPGFLYRLQWPLPAGDSRPAVEIPAYELSMFERRIQKLLKTAEHAASHDEAAVQRYQTESADLKLIVDAIPDLLRVAGCALSDVHVNLMVFDEVPRLLRPVLSTSSSITSAWDTSLYAGEGCAGLCYEKCRIVLYDPRDDPDGYYLRPNEFGAATREPGTEHSALVCLPWFYLGRVMGVINIGSYERPTILEKVFALARAESEKLLHELTWVSNAVVNGILFKESTGAKG